MIGEELRQELYDFAGRDWLVSRVAKTPEARRALVDATAYQVNRVSELRGGTIYITSEDKKQLKSDIAASLDPKQFIDIAFILTIVISWAIQRLLDYLWDHWKISPA